MTLSLVTLSQLEKAARDNGFDLGDGVTGDWMSVSSSHVPLRLAMGEGAGGLLLALSEKAVFHSLAQGLVGPTAVAPPEGMVAVGAVPSFAALHRAVRRAYQLSSALPDRPLGGLRLTKDMPRTTEVERMAVQRVGQDLFRAGLLAYWEGRCAVTGLAVPELLRASHIKPWAVCKEDAERLDVFNGLLLAPNLDAAFDQGFISVSDDGTVQVAGMVTPADRKVLGLAGPLSIVGLAEAHRAYLSWHREVLFKK